MTSIVERRRSRSSVVVGHLVTNGRELGTDVPGELAPRARTMARDALSSAPGGVPMRVLFMGSPGSRTDETARRLAEAGHDVVTCHDRDRPPFPCNGVRGRCPLDEGAIDVAFVVRDRVWPRPTPFDRGATCAIRQRVPLVLQGSEILNPYEEWTDAVVTPAGDPLPVLERTARQVRVEHSTVATEALRACLEGEGANARCIAEVRSRNGQLEVRAWVPDSMPAMERQNAAARVAGALRRFDRRAAGIDVSVEPVKTDPTFVTTPSRTS